MTGSALAGGEPGRPALMRDIVVDGLGGEPKRLLELHDAFGCDSAGGAADLDKVVTGFNGEDGKAGKRMATLMGAFKSRDTGISDADLAKKLKDPFLDQIETLNVAAKAPTVGGQLRTPTPVT